MEILESIYLVCFFAGVGFAVISGLLSGVFSGGAEGAADIDVNAGGDFDAGAADGDAGGAVDAGAMHFPAVGPVTISMFIASFGGTGIVLNKLGWSVLAQVPTAAASGFVMAALIFYLFYKIFSITGGSSTPGTADIVGVEAQVTTTIPVNGVGEIAYSVGTSRHTAPARCEDGKEIGVQSVVKISKIVGNTYYVERVT